MIIALDLNYALMELMWLMLLDSSVVVVMTTNPCVTLHIIESDICLISSLFNSRQAVLIAMLYFKGKKELNFEFI